MYGIKLIIPWIQLTITLIKNKPYILPFFFFIYKVINKNLTRKGQDIFLALSPKHWTRQNKEQTQEKVHWLTRVQPLCKCLTLTLIISLNTSQSTPIWFPASSLTIKNSTNTKVKATTQKKRKTKTQPPAHLSARAWIRAASLISWVESWRHDVRILCHFHFTCRVAPRCHGNSPPPVGM